MAEGQYPTTVKPVARGAVAESYDDNCDILVNMEEEPGQIYLHVRQSACTIMSIECIQKKMRASGVLLQHTHYIYQLLDCLEVQMDSTTPQGSASLVHCIKPVERKILPRPLLLTSPSRVISTTIRYLQYKTMTTPITAPIAIPSTSTTSVGTCCSR